MRKSLFLFLPAFALAGLSAQAATITLLDDHFDNGTVGTDVNGENGGFTTVNISGSGNSTTESGTVLTHDATGTNNRSGIMSSNSFDPTTYSSFTATWVVTSYEDPSANGFNLIVASDQSLSAPFVNFQFEGANSSTLDIVANDGSVGGSLLTDEGITASQARDGFTLTATFDASGVSYSATGLASLTSGSVAYALGQTYASLFDGTTFIGANIQAPGGTDASFVIDRITVTAVPEPSSAALLGLGAVSLLGFRRRPRG